MQEITVGGHLREVRPGTYYVVGDPDSTHRPVAPAAAETGRADPGRSDEPRSAGAADSRAGSKRPAQVRHGGAGDLKLTHYRSTATGDSLPCNGRWGSRPRVNVPGRRTVPATP